MFDLGKPVNADIWPDLIAAADAVTAGERDPVANMANVSALLFDWLHGLNWAGFYRLGDGELVLGPFQGKAACIRIAVGSGVCGTAVSERTTQRVADVHAFPGHIACDSASNSELVVPVIVDDVVIAVIDLDSPEHDRFSAADAAGCEALAALIGPRIRP